MNWRQIAFLAVPAIVITAVTGCGGSQSSDQTQPPTQTQPNAGNMQNTQPAVGGAAQQNQMAPPPAGFKAPPMPPGAMQRRFPPQ
ncbi:MAG TPA: hypothetical protein VF600_09100 [Abditibacteriaceae bacterium]|jgi:hypothetical protein